MATGAFRLKDRRSRRPAFPRENLLQYGWRRTKDSFHGLRVYGGLFFEFQEIWMLTRKPKDPRWATLSDLRTKWAQVQRRAADYSLQGRYSDAARELKTILSSTADRLRQMSRAGSQISLSLRRKLRKKAAEAEGYLRAFDEQPPGWNQVVDAERFVSRNIIAGYEEVAIRYVAKRRQISAFRRDLVKRVKAGQLLGIHVLRIPYAAICEVFFASRFAVHFLTRI